ncbi:MAG: hypothetical protein MN733_06455 [Nitrososphaera sp.]|nr:hypothetical protein [Nitrososphaera sp.]
MPAPSGFTFSAIKRVSPIEIEKASEALDRALLREIGLPEEVEIREFENAVAAIAEQVKFLATDFSLSKLIAVLPAIVMDGAALWERLEPKLSGKIERKEFITKVVRYVYRRNDPDLPYLIEPFETLVEDMILNAVPELVDNLEVKLAELIGKLTSIFK